VSLVRTDVEDYGSVILVALPFEWTTQRNLRVGFEIGYGQAMGGHERKICVPNCGTRNIERVSSNGVIAQFSMGWALGSL
jgi:hypothetical protein